MAQLDAIEQRAKSTVTRVHLDCQHSPPTEMPDETVDAIAQFLDGLISLTEESYDGPAAQVLVSAYVDEIRAMYPDWTPDVPPRLTPEDVEPPAGRWLVAYRKRQPVGCAALKRLDNDTAEIKRVYVAPEARGTGVARAVAGPARDDRPNDRIHHGAHGYRRTATRLGGAVRLGRVRPDRGLQRQSGRRVLVREAARMKLGTLSTA